MLDHDGVHENPPKNGPDALYGWIVCGFHLVFLLVITVRD